MLKACDGLDRCLAIFGHFYGGYAALAGLTFTPEKFAMADIFISYLSEDIGAAERLAGALDAQGWSVFWDRRIPAGKRFDDFLDEQLQAARCVIVLWSRKSIFSTWVRDEAAVGRDRGILVPAHLDDILPPFGFRSIQSANLIGWQGDTDQWGFQKLLQAVRAAIEVAEGREQQEAEAKRRATEEERQRREQQEAEAKRRATEAERQRREQQEAEAKRRATEGKRQRREQQEAEAKRRATEAERQRREQQEAEAKRRATEAERQRREQQEAEAKRRATEAERQRREQQEAEAKRRATEAERQRREQQEAGLKRALSFDREKRTPSVEHFVSDLLRPTLIATGIVATFVAAAGVGYTLWPRHQQEPVALTSAPLPPEGRKDSAAIEPEVPAQHLPEPVAAIRPPYQPEIPETQPVPPDTVAVERLLSNVRCSALEGVVRGRTLVVDGYLGDRQSLAAVLGPLAQAAGDLDVSTDQIREMDPLYCRPLEVLRSFVAANRDRDLSLAVSTAGTDGSFREGDKVLLTIKAPEHDSYIYVDYFSLDGNVVHMLPNPASRDNRLAASGQTRLGDGGPAGSWTVGEPFGTELITVISSRKPLFSKVRQAVEPSAGYLADLDKALARVGMDAGSAEISFIHTEPPPDTVAVERLLSNVRCSALEGVVRGRTLVVDGYLGDRQSLAAVLGPLAQAAGDLDVSTDQIREMDPLYCRPLEVLRSFVAANRDRDLSLAVSTAGTDGSFREGDKVLLTIKAPEHDSYIYVDYFSLDGNVVHMLPNPASRDNRLAASGQARLGDGGPAGSWTVGEPFGTELIAVISSRKPLFSKVRQAVEPSAGYLADLDKALARVGMDAGSAEISFIHTERQS